MLKYQAGDALAVNFSFQLHHMPDESVNTKQPSRSDNMNGERISPKGVDISGAII